MHIFSYLLESWIIGLAVAAILGPIGMLCIRKTLELGLWGGLSVGVGAALGDCIYGLIAGAGVTIISDFLLEKTIFIKMLGGVFLVYLGIKECVHSLPAKMTLSSSRKKFFSLAGLTFFLTLSNPVTILSFIAIFASIGGKDISTEATIWMVFGIFLGSMTWWIILSNFIVFSKKYVSNKWLYRIKYVSAFILIGFGGWSLLVGILERF